MSERITRANVEARVENVNRRLAETGTFVQAQGRNGYIGLDEYAYVNGHDGTDGIRCMRTLLCGTKREVADFLHAMMVGIDLSRQETPEP